MRAEIFPSTARGMIKVPPSKSMAHRALIAAALAEGESLLSPIALSKDMEATVNGLTAMGAVFTREGEALRVRGFGKKPRNLGVLNCIESGSTLRFLIPLCLLTGETYVLEGASRLMERPLSVYEKLCGDEGFLFEKEGNTLKVRGKLSSGEYTVAGDISSQFITGLLFALSLLSGDSVLRVTGVWESASYIDMTLDAMEVSDSLTSEIKNEIDEMMGDKDISYQLSWEQYSTEEVHLNTGWPLKLYIDKYIKVTPPEGETEETIESKSIEIIL